MNSMLLKLATTQGTSLKVDSGDVSQGVADATKGVTDATQDAVNEVNQATQYLQEHLSDLDRIWSESADRNCSIYDRACSDPIYTENCEKIAGKVQCRQRSRAVRRLCFEIFFIFSVDFYDCSKIRS